MARGGPVLHAGYRERQLHAGARPPGPSRLRPWPAHCPLASLHGCRGSPGHGRWCVDCGGGGQGRVPTGDCASVPAARARPAVEAAAGTEAATTATTRHHQGRTSSSSYTGDTTCTHHHQPHEPAPSSTGSRGHHPPPPTTSNHGLQLYSQHGEAAPLHLMLFLVTAKTFDQVYIPLLNIPLH